MANTAKHMLLPGHQLKATSLQQNPAMVALRKLPPPWQGRMLDELALGRNLEIQGKAINMDKQHI
jgi:hypothetical protein